MRRSAFLKEVSKSSEKKQCDLLIKAIAIEQTVLTDLNKINAETSMKADRMKDECTIIEDELLKKQNAVVDTTKEIDELEIRLRELQSQVYDLEGSVETLAQKRNEIQVLLVLEQESSTKEMSRLLEVGARAVAVLQAKKESLISDITDLESRVMVLIKSESAILESIRSRGIEQKNLDSAIVHRMQELTRIKSEFSSSHLLKKQSEKELSDINSKIESLKSEIIEKDKVVFLKNEELRRREEEIELKRKELVGVMLREKTVLEREGAMRDLFDMAGLNI